MYEYEREKQEIFTERGQVMFLKIRDNVNSLIDKAGAVRMQEAISGQTGDCWHMMACVDRLVEIGEIKELVNPNAAGQYRVFTR